MNNKFRYIKIKDEQPRKKKGSKRKKAKVMRAIGNTMTVLGVTVSSMLLVLVIMMCIVVTVVTVYILDFKDSSVEINLKETDMKYTSIIYAYNADGQEVELKRLVKEENRIWVNYEDISPNIINAVVAKEDKRFWDHKGVDWRRTVAALLYDVLGTSKEGQGGSTITQQLIKNITEDDKKTWARKLREIFRALDVEEKYNKEQILESYLNRIAFGGMNYGI
ncbi:MAG: transglycosylase domain-containing protein, partial [Oscillospiraceae bacterium]